MTPETDRAIVIQVINDAIGGALTKTKLAWLELWRTTKNGSSSIPIQKYDCRM